MSMHRIAIILALFGLHTVSSLQEFNSIDADQAQDSKALRGRLLSHDTPEWWPKIKSYYDGKDLQLCRSKSVPKSGSNCGFKKKTCFFETQKCSKVGVYPKKRCSCNGNKEKKGKWSCEQAKCPAGPIKTASPTPAPTSSPKGTFVSSAGRAFKVKMNLLSSKVLDGYDNVKDLKSDLYQAIHFYVNALIEEQSMYDGKYFPVGVGGGPLLNEDSPDISPPSAEGATDFETNNQEKGVDESDMVKSDGKFVYAAYGDMVVVWNSLTGKLVENYTLPPIYDNSPTPAPRKSSSSDMKLDIMPPIYYNPRPYILSMSLAANRLVLYVQGYGEKLRAEENYSSPFWNDFDTRIVILDTSTLPSKITFVSQEDIQGSFVSGSSIGSDVHVVTTSYMDVYRLAGPLYRWNKSFEGMNKAQYKAAAAEIAVPFINDYVEALFNSIVTKGIAPSMPKISLWQSNLGENENIVESIYSGGAIQAYMQLTSFSVKGLNGKATFSKAGVFTPSGWGYTYAIEGNLVFAAQGWNWSPWLQGSSQTTYLLGFKLDGASATPAYLGSVDGYILNQYSLSIFEGHLRIATTVDTFWPIWEPSGSETTTPQPESRTNNTVHVLRLPKGDDASLKPVTSIRNLGKPNERFTSFRCFKIICYAGESKCHNTNSTISTTQSKLYINIQLHSCKQIHSMC
jgi:Beta propeller domain